MSTLLYANIAFLFLIQVTNLNSQGLNCITTPNGANIFAAGDSGIVLFSSNSGNDWVSKKISSSNLKSIYSLNQNIWITNDAGNIYKFRTNDSLLFQSYAGENIVLTSIHFIDENIGMICGENGKVFKTSNGGVNWNLSNNGISYSRLNSIVFKDNLNGYVAGNNGMIYRTSNGGQSWMPELSNTTFDLLKSYSRRETMQLECFIIVCTS